MDVTEANVQTGEVTERDYTQQELDNIAAANARELPQRQKREAMEAQIETEKSDMPTWSQVVNAIDNAFTDNAQANIIKKIARPVYSYLKKTVN